VGGRLTLDSWLLRTGAAMAMVAATIACGKPVEGPETIAFGGSAPVATPSPSAADSQWPTYTDADYKFTVSYPPSFTFQRQHGSPGTGLLMLYRAVDPIYLNTYPPGQIEIGIYSMDTLTLSGWVAKHSGPPRSTNLTRYWTAGTNQNAVTSRSPSGLSFDWLPDTGSPTIHATALFLGASQVLVLDWWSNNPSDAATLEPYYQRMLKDLQE